LIQCCRSSPGSIHCCRPSSVDPLLETGPGLTHCCRPSSIDPLLETGPGLIHLGRRGCF
jgi:hypothetical protein